ncbi:MAG: flagellar hook-associated protein FlgK [Rhodospirillales bacterium]|nr:flagellar hook-associated protein FlgK [Rhodospirillales bacterium]
MSINATLSIATGGLAAVSRELALVSQNIANANTPDYAREIATQTALTAEGQGLGVHVGPATRLVDTVLQAAALRQNAVVADLQARQSALQAIDAAQGTPGDGTDLPSLLGKLQSAFSTLLNQPADQTQQSAVVAAAGTLTQGINDLSEAYATQRQDAQDALVTAVGTLNATIADIGRLSDQIIALQGGGQSTADLENQRDAALHTLSDLIDLRVLHQANGDVVLSSSGGLSLPVHGTGAALATTGANLHAGAYYPGGGIPGITLNGVDVTRELTGGRIGAALTLRDLTLPTAQAELDEFAQTLATRFDAQGLRLFSDPTGAVPPGGGTPVQSTYVGFAASIQVNPAVRANPTLVRDGTTAIAGSATGASAFTPNPASGPAGFTTMITRVLTYALGREVQSGVPQPAANTTGLGPDGTLRAPYVAPLSLGDMATTMVAAQAQDSSLTSARLATEQAVQSGLAARLSAMSGVNVDTEMAHMITLQNAYGANARVMATAQALFQQLLTMVQ